MRDFLLCILMALTVAVQCETIHFTNSPSHLVGSKNITSYKLLLKNSDPITIIEANKEPEERTNIKENWHPNDRIDINVDDSADSPYHKDYHVKLIANMGGSHQLDTAPTQNVRGTVGLTITGSPSKSPISGSIDFKKNDHDVENDPNNVNAKKVVYSPILLKKFMQEYSEKLQNADVLTKNEIQKIHEKIHEQQTTSSTNKNDEVLESDKSAEEVEQKYNWNGYRDSYEDERRKRPSDPYKDRDGWVTLEAVPWSSSSVSKWHPYGQDDDTRRRPSPNSARPYKHDKFSYHDDADDDYYSRPKPSYLDRDKRPGVHSAWTKPQSYNSNGRPSPKPYRFSDSGSFGSYKISEHHGSARPWPHSDDIITDNRPSDFPSDYHRPNYNDDDQYNAASSNIHPSYQERPSEGNGEWVLVSTTKGYQAQSGNRRQKGNRAMFTTDAQSNVLVTAPNTMRMHKALKLTVLPALEPAKNSTFSTDPAHKPVTTIIHGGMLEIDATHVSIEDDVRKKMQAQKKTTTMSPPVKAPSTENKNRKLLKGNFKLFERIE